MAIISESESRAQSTVDRVDQSARVLVAISVHALSPRELTAANKSIAELSHHSARSPATGRAPAIKVGFVFAVSSRRYVGSNFARLAKSAADGSLSRAELSLRNSVDPDLQKLIYELFLIAE